jgi:3-deoxy-D-manno-octulosonic-acid transferase
MSLALHAYRLLARVLAPLWRRTLRDRLARGKETPESVAQKLFEHAPERPPGNLIWGHAVGVGEVLALAGLLRQLGERMPDASFLITSSARSSGQVLASGNLPPRTRHQFAPIDTPDTVRRFLDHWRPNLGIWCEMDLWPVTLDAATRRGIPCVLVNARMSTQSLARRRRARALYRPILGGFRAIWAQNEETARSLTELGAHGERIRVTGTIKSIAVPLGVDEVELERLGAAFEGRHIWLLASSHEGEEVIGLQAHQQLRAKYPDALLIIAPRYPTRAEEILSICPPGSVRRSQSVEALPEGEGVYIADTFGEMGLWYRLARIAFVGGSLVPVGGHNPFEPLALGCQVMHGPEVMNFSEAYETLNHLGLSHQVSGAADMAAHVSEAWSTRSRDASPGKLTDWTARLSELVRLTDPPPPGMSA